MTIMRTCSSLMVAITVSLTSAFALYAQGNERPKSTHPPQAGPEGGLGAQGAGPSAANDSGSTYRIDPALADDGARVWTNKGCDVCHGIGQGKVTGPDLQGVTLRRKPQWLHNWIRNPRNMAQTDPTAQGMVQAYNNIIMPNLQLSEQQIAAVISYIDRESREKGQS